MENSVLWTVISEHKAERTLNSEQGVAESGRLVDSRNLWNLPMIPLDQTTNTTEDKDFTGFHDKMYGWIINYHAGFHDNIVGWINYHVESHDKKQAGSTITSNTIISIKCVLEHMHKVKTIFMLLQIIVELYCSCAWLAQVLTSTAILNLKSSL